MSINSKSRQAIKKLRKTLGEGVVFTDKERLYRSAMDNARLVFLPDALLKPSHDEQITEILKLANREHIAVTPRGAGTAVTGATSPVKGGWVLDLSSWQKISIDKFKGLAHVEAGAITEKINATASPYGWFYPPDPSSKKFSTIGGNLATNAGGCRGAKYGVTRDYVLALEGFLPTGEFVRWGAPLRKFASGYNLRDLWIGSEGTLGVIVRASLKLLPKPDKRYTYLFGFPSEVEALDAVWQILAGHINPSIMEFLDRQTVDCTLLHMQRQKRNIKNSVLTQVINAFPSTPSLLLIECDGDEGALNGVEHRLISLLNLYSRVPYRKAHNERDAEALWTIRRSCSQAMFQMGDTKINEDVVLPLESYHKFIEFTLELKILTGLATPTFGHVADGNFHVHLMYNHKDPEHCKQAEKGVDLLMDKIIELEGAITGEHGIGLTKTPFLRRQHSAIEIDVMKRIKQVFDPNGILNPGKIFEPFNLWEHERDYDIVFPWDIPKGTSGNLKNP